MTKMIAMLSMAAAAAAQDATVLLQAPLEVEKMNNTDKPDWKCKEVQPMENFDIDMYMSKPWYVQMQKPISYQPPAALNCVRAQYISKKDGMPMTTPMGERIADEALAKLFGWDVFVSNQAWDASMMGGGQKETLGFLCANQVKGAKLEVAPCFLPKFAAGDYWVLAHNEAAGYAVIVGGQTDHPTTNGKCEYKDGAFSAAAADQGSRGIWIFSRTPIAAPGVMAEALLVLEENRIDTSRMLPVRQVGCQYGMLHKTMAQAEAVRLAR